VRKLEIGLAGWEEKLTGHLAACEKRGARLERLAWWTGGLVVTSLISTVGTLFWLLVKTIAKNGGVG
jgi:hypothetical protein